MIDLEMKGGLTLKRQAVAILRAQLEDRRSGWNPALDVVGWKPCLPVVIVIIVQ